MTDYSCPECQKQAVKHWECAHRRSPPVSFLKLGMSDIPVSH